MSGKQLQATTSNTRCQPLHISERAMLRIVKKVSSIIDDEWRISCVVKSSPKNTVLIVRQKKLKLKIERDFAKYRNYLDKLSEAVVKLSFPLFRKIQPTFAHYSDEFTKFVKKIKQHEHKRDILDNFYTFLYLYMYHMHNIQHVYHHNNEIICKNNFGIALIVDTKDSHKPKLICAIDSQKLQLLKLMLANSNDRHFYNPDTSAPLVADNLRFDDKMLTANLLVVHLLERLIQIELTSYFHNFRHEKYYFVSQLLADTPNIDINNFLVK